MKSAFFFIDDIIWLFRDLTRQRPESMFDHFFLKGLKQAHRLYGAKFQLNAFYSTDPRHGKDMFTMAEMTDAYRAEWEGASDWLKFGVHAWKEFPDYSFLDMSYGEATELMETVRTQVRRFAGERSFSDTMVPHWGPASLDACRAFKDCGIRLLWASNPACRPQWTWRHNHLSDEEADATRCSAYQHYDPVTGLYFKRLLSTEGPINSLSSVADVDRVLSPLLDREHLTLATHEQYFYPDYCMYKPDHMEMLLRACQLLCENGYTFLYAHELLDKSDR